MQVSRPGAIPPRAPCGAPYLPLAPVAQFLELMSGNIPNIPRGIPGPSLNLRRFPAEGGEETTASNLPRGGLLTKISFSDRIAGIDKEKPVQGLSMAQTGIAEVRPPHESILDILIAEPFITLAQLSARTGYSISWLSQIKRSGCF